MQAIYENRRSAGKDSRNEIRVQRVELAKISRLIVSQATGMDRHRGHAQHRAWLSCNVLLLLSSCPPRQESSLQDVSFSDRYVVHLNESSPALSMSDSRYLCLSVFWCLFWLELETARGLTFDDSGVAYVESDRLRLASAVARFGRSTLLVWTA